MTKVNLFLAFVLGACAGTTVDSVAEAPDPVASTPTAAASAEVAPPRVAQVNGGDGPKTVCPNSVFLGHSQSVPRKLRSCAFVSLRFSHSTSHAGLLGLNRSNVSLPSSEVKYAAQDRDRDQHGHAADDGAGRGSFRRRRVLVARVVVRRALSESS